MENIQGKPGAMKAIVDRLKNAPNEKRSAIRWPRLEGLLRGRAVWIIGNSPSLLKIENLYERLSHPRIITVAINRVIDRMDPTFWFCGDEEFTTQYGNILPGPGPDLTQTVQILNLGAGAALKMGTPWVPFRARLRDKGWGRHMDRIYHYPTSDLQAIQVFHGVCEAATVFLVGVDHAVVDNKTHAFELTGMDLEKQQNIHEIKYGDEVTPHQAMITQGYKKARREFQRTARRIYTCSPVEDTVVRKYIPYRDFDTALDHSMKAPHPPDLTELLNWKPHGGKFSLTI